MQISHLSMKQVFYLLITIISIINTSCSKDVSTPLGDRVDSLAPAPASGLLIKKIVQSRVAGDSQVVNYVYDKNSRLIEQDARFFVNSTSSPTIKPQGRRYHRDPSGRIMKIAIKSVSDTPLLIDTMYYKVIYESAASTKVAYILGQNAPYGKAIYDSTAFEYDANGNVKKTTSYASIDWPAIAAVNSETKIYQFDNNSNLLKLEVYSGYSSNGTLNLVFVYDFVYDDKINPLFAKDDDARINEWLSKNNVTVQKVYEPYSNYRYDNLVQYEYDLNNKPVLSAQSGNYPNSVKYFYSK